MAITILGQQYNVGEKPTVILYTYINRHAGAPEKQQKALVLGLLDEENAIASREQIRSFCNVRRAAEWFMSSVHIIIRCR